MGWEQVIESRLNGTDESRRTAETEAIRQLWSEHTRMLNSRPLLEAVQMTAEQRQVLTETCHILGDNSELTRRLMAAFGLVWGWPDHAPPNMRVHDHQRELQSARPVPVAQPSEPPVPTIPVPEVEVPPVMSSAPTPGESPIMGTIEVAPSPPIKPLDGPVVTPGEFLSDRSAYWGTPTVAEPPPHPVKPEPPRPAGPPERGKATEHVTIVREP